MAGADIKKMPFGYVLGGTGADETEVFSGKVRIKLMMFSGNADNATCSLTTKDNGGGTYYSCGMFKSNDTNELNSASGNYMWFGEKGVEFNGLKANMSHANDRLYIYLA